MPVALRSRAEMYVSKLRRNGGAKDCSAKPCTDRRSCRSKDQTEKQRFTNQTSIKGLHLQPLLLHQFRKPFPYFFNFRFDDELAIRRTRIRFEIILVII